MMGSPVLVTGSTGALGPRVVSALLAAGRSVRTFSLAGTPTQLDGGDIDIRVGDITSAAQVRDAVHGVDSIIHLAALLHFNNPAASMRSEYERINIGGTLNILRAAREAGVRRVVFFSTIAVYGPSSAPEVILDESTAVRPETMYGETKLEAERRVLDAVRPDGTLLGTVLRLGAVYGARIKGNYARLVRSLARGRFVPVGSGSNRRTLVYDRDVAKAALLAMEHPLAAGRVYNVTDGGFHPLREVISEICLALNRKPPRWALPIGPARLSLALFDAAAKTAPWRLPSGCSMLDKYLEDVAVDGSRIQRELGFVPEYDLRRGWRETVSEMRTTGIM
jgi:UDP-glucose 4-epimerase